MITSDNYIKKYVTSAYGEFTSNKPHFIEMENQPEFISHPLRRFSPISLDSFLADVPKNIIDCWHIESTDSAVILELAKGYKTPKPLDELYDTLLDHITLAVYRDVTDIFCNVEDEIVSDYSNPIHNEYFKWKK
jgi:hypothetical protein